MDDLNLLLRAKSRQLYRSDDDALFEENPMSLLRNAFTSSWCFIAFAVPLSSFAASGPLGQDFVVALNPASGNAYRSEMIWYLKGIADQREISEAISARMSKSPCLIASGLCVATSSHLRCLQPKLLKKLLA